MQTIIFVSLVANGLLIKKRRICLIKMDYIPSNQMYIIVY